MSEMLQPVPRVKVLLATFNGASWIDQQLDSIEGQQGVDVSIVASDDSSTDDTISRMRRKRAIPLSMLPSASQRFGSAHRNFFRLIRDAELSDAEYIAFADQDDIWLPNKLARGVSCLRAQSAQGYSSNVTAFWPNGQQLLIDKAQPLRRFDHLFGSPGPGCTFILPRPVFEHLRHFVSVNFDRLQFIWMHDWLIYAFVRCRGGRWHIDDRPTMLYRQHGNNVIGVNVGLRAAVSRMRRVRSGAYRRDILSIADVLGEPAEVISAIRRLAIQDRIKLVLKVRQFRRRLSECFALAAFIMLMPSDSDWNGRDKIDT